MKECAALRELEEKRPEMHRLLVALAGTLLAKGHDYADTNDPYANFRGSTEMGIAPWKGALVRASDKIQRLKRFAASGDFQVGDETLRDTCVDLMGYAAITAHLHQEEDGDEEPFILEDRASLAGALKSDCEDVKLWAEGLGFVGDDVLAGAIYDLTRMQGCVLNGDSCLLCGNIAKGVVEKIGVAGDVNRDQQYLVAGTRGVIGRRIGGLLADARRLQSLCGGEECKAA